MIYQIFYHFVYVLFENCKFTGRRLLIYRPNQRYLHHRTRDYGWDHDSEQSLCPSSFIEAKTLRNSVFRFHCSLGNSGHLANWRHLNKSHVTGARGAFHISYCFNHKNNITIIHDLLQKTICNMYTNYIMSVFCT